MINGVVAFLVALPKILDLMNRMGNWMTTNDITKWMSQLEVHIDNLEKSKTSEDKLAAAQGLLTSLRGL